MPRITIFLVVLAHLAFAQQPAVTIETFSMHMVNSQDEEDIESTFPIVHSGNPIADLNINNVLQTAYFGAPLTEKSIAAFRAEYSPWGDHVFSFFSQVTDRFVVLTIGRFQTNNAMSLNGYSSYTSRMFDLRSGQEFSPLAMFSEEGVLLFLGKAFPGFRRSYNTTMDRYMEGFSKMKSAKQTETCDCHCEDVLQDVFRDNRALFSFSKDNVSLQMDACSWMNPGPHDSYEHSIPMSDIRPWLSPFGKYMIDNGPAVNLTARPYLLLQGKLGDDIHTTFVLHKQANNEVTGYEIYNSVGGTIKLHGKFAGTLFTFDEVTPEGKAVANFKADLKEGRMTGSWTKSDKSRTLAFSGVEYY